MLFLEYIRDRWFIETHLVKEVAHAEADPHRTVEVRRLQDL